jgi:nicotinamide-nucleotide amidase
LDGGQEDAMVDLAKSVVEALQQRGWRVATAESCTAGSLAKVIATTEGASEVFAGGVVAYQKATKTRVLSVPPEALSKPGGAVSAEVAELMALGVTELMESNIGVATTGVLGPASDEDGNPVGRVCVGVAIVGGQSVGRSYNFAGLTAEEICERTLDAALVMVAQALAQRQ